MNDVQGYTFRPEVTKKWSTITFGYTVHMYVLFGPHIMG